MIKSVFNFHGVRIAVSVYKGELTEKYSSYPLKRNNTFDHGNLK